MKKIIQHIVKKEFIQFRKDKKMVVMSFISPILQLLLLGYAANVDVKYIPTVVCDLDNTSISREYISDVTNSNYFEIVRYVDKMNDIDAIIDNGSASVGITIPKNFSNDIISGKTTQIQSMIDGSDSNTATIGMNYLSMITGQFSQKFLSEKMDQLKKLQINTEVISPELRVWYNPELKSRNFMVPGVLGLLLMVMTLILTSMAIVKEKENGTLEQLIVTPIKSIELIIGKLIPFIIIGLIDVILVVAVATLWFHVPMRGSLITLIILSLTFLLSTLGLGLFVSSISSNQQQAMMTSMFFLMLPMIYLSGFIFPIENMPKIIQYVTYILPLRYYFVIIRGIFLKGVGFAELWKDTFMIFILGVSILTVSIARFQKRVG